MACAPNEDSDQPVFIGFVMRRLKCEKVSRYASRLCLSKTIKCVLIFFGNSEITSICAESHLQVYNRLTSDERLLLSSITAAFYGESVLSYNNHII